MFDKIKIRVEIFVALLSSISLLITACSPSAIAPGGTEPGFTTLIGAHNVPPPAARPAGAPAAPQVTPASYYEPVGPFYFYVETLASANATKYGLASTVACVQSGVFKRGMRVVFRFEILDTSTGKRITDKDGAAIKVRLPHAEEMTARWSVRGGANALPDSAWMWVVPWEIPPDYPLGTLDYSILITAKDGRTAAFIPPLYKTKTSDSRLRIID